jgi:hypothetical protein
MKRPCPQRMPGIPQKFWTAFVGASCKTVSQHNHAHFLYRRMSNNLDSNLSQASQSSVIARVLAKGSLEGEQGPGAAFRRYPRTAPGRFSSPSRLVE